MSRHFKLAALVLTATLAALAQSQSAATKFYRSGEDWVQEVSGYLPAGKIVKVKSSSGSIHVQGAQQKNITFTVRQRVRTLSEQAARRQLAHMTYTTSSSGEVVLFRADCEGANNGSIDFDIQVPAQTATVVLKTEGGAVVAKDLLGKVEANTSAGSIQLDRVAGVVVVSSGGGDIEIGKAGSDVNVHTDGGSIRLASASGRLVASSGGGNLDIGWAKSMALETGGGFIRVAKCDGQVKAETAGGNVELVEVDGPAQIETGGGSIHIGPVKGGVHAETGAGVIVAKLASGKEPFTDSRLESSVGDIIVYVPEGLGLNVRAAVELAQGYGIHSEFPELKITSADQPSGPRETYAEGTLNGGGPTLHVHTTSGNIEFRRRARQQ